MTPLTVSDIHSFRVFEGPEKRLLVSFASDARHVNLRRVLHSDYIQRILTAASCTVLSVQRNKRFDAFLLSESSLFVADDAIMLKTCGTTTLLRALPVIIDVAAACDIVPTTVSYSRVRFQHPELQPWPHASFVDEVTYLDNTLHAQGTPLQMGAGDWHVYVAHLGQSTAVPKSPTHTLEIFMFDLDPTAMHHFFDAGPDAQLTTKKSGIASLLPDDAIIDEYNFEPCGYSLNAIDESGCITIHVSPEPQASYVSFESTADSDCLADTVAKVVKLFRPSRFTVAFVGSEDCKAFIKCRKAPVDWLKLSKLLGGEFQLAGEPATVRASAWLWASAGKYSRDAGMKVAFSPMEQHLSNSILDEVSRNFNVVPVAAVDEVSKARAAMSTNNVGEHPMYIVDVKQLEQRALRVRWMLPEKYALRYAVRCNPDVAVLMILNSLGWSFETVSVAEVGLLLSVGVKKEQIVFSSPIISKAVLACMNDIGIVSVFCIPDGELKKVMRDAGVGVEVRVPTGAVDDTVALCESVLDISGKIESFVLDYSLDEQFIDVNRSVEWPAAALDTIKMVKQRLPPSVVEDARLCIGELCPLEDENLLKQVLTEVDMGLIISPGPWVVGPCMSVVVNIVGLRLRKCEVYSYYLNDGVYGAFGFVAMGRSKGLEPPEILTKKIEVESSSDDGTSAVSLEMFHSVLFGPTCDAIDRVWSGALPRLEIGDSLVFRGMGAYAVSTSTSFNGFPEGFHTVYVAGGDDCGVFETSSNSSTME